MENRGTETVSYGTARLCNFERKKTIPERADRMSGKKNIWKKKDNRRVIDATKCTLMCIASSVASCFRRDVIGITLLSLGILRD